MSNQEIVMYHYVIVTKDKENGRELFRKNFIPYFATPVYNRYLAWAGYSKAANTISEGWIEKDRIKTARALDDALVNKLAIIGAKEECQERIREYARGGIHTHIICCISPNESQTTHEAFTPDNFSP